MPSVAASYDIPKQNFTLRHAIQVAPVDRIIYQGLVDRLIVAIDPKLTAATFSHRLRGASTEYIFKNSVQQWKNFRAAVRDTAGDPTYSYLVVTDIAQYYENIDFRKLKPQLENVLGEDLTAERQACIDAIIGCLKRWSPYRFRGLPQNLDASSFIGNAFLDYVDRRMTRVTPKYFRYMDDIRILTSNEADARKMLMILTVLLREQGLGVNARKTEMIERDSQRWGEVLAPEDRDLNEIDELVKSRDHDLIQQGANKVVEKTRGLLSKRQTGEGAFRFCINRLVSLRRYRGLEWPDLADITDSLLELLVSRPCDTDIVCRYLSVSDFNARQDSRLESLVLSEPRCVYPWQNYHLWVLLVQRRLRSGALLAKAYEILENSAADPNLSGACLYLGACGEYADRTAVRNRYSLEQPYPVRRAQLVALQELHAVDRTPLYREERSDPSFSALTEHLDGLADPVYVPDPPPVERDEIFDFTLSVY